MQDFSIYTFQGEDIYSCSSVLLCYIGTEVFMYVKLCTANCGDKKDGKTQRIHCSDKNCCQMSLNVDRVQINIKA